MIQSLWSAASGMQAQQLKVDAIANNLANVNTAGFKASRVSFQDLAYVTLPAPGGSAGTAGGGAAGGAGATGAATSAASAALVQVGTGVGPATILRDQSPGPLEATERPFDLAIDGPGFFMVKLADGTTAYTRDGHFSVSPLDSGRGLLVDADGNPVLDAGGQTIEVRLDVPRVSVDATGTISYVLADGSAQTGGRVGLARFPNPAGLEALGGGRLRATPAAGEARKGNPGEEGLGLIRQGFLEQSNVQVVAEMVNLIVAQRAYELNARVIRGADEMLQVANELRR